jgi:hypothetical protein
MLRASTDLLGATNQIGCRWVEAIRTTRTRPELPDVVFAPTSNSTGAQKNARKRTAGRNLRHFQVGDVGAHHGGPVCGARVRSAFAAMRSWSTDEHAASSARIEHAFRSGVGDWNGCICVRLGRVPHRIDTCITDEPISASVKRRL